jgi:hypothetical protein
MVSLGDQWNDWEMQKAYREEKPKWLYLLGIFSFAIIGLTWYKVMTTTIDYSWIIAVIVSLTTIKIGNLLFNYDNFRKFADTVLRTKKYRKIMNISVFVISLVFIWMGIYLY